jgi:hypothetical protein
MLASFAFMSVKRESLLAVTFEIFDNKIELYIVLVIVHVKKRGVIW